MCQYVCVAMFPQSSAVATQPSLAQIFSWPLPPLDIDFSYYFLSHCVALFKGLDCFSCQYRTSKGEVGSSLLL